MFPPKASFAEKDTPDQLSRVFIVTGGSAGIGYELISVVASTWPPAQKQLRKLQSPQSKLLSLRLGRS